MKNYDSKKNKKPFKIQTKKEEIKSPNCISELRHIDFSMTKYYIKDKSDFVDKI
jgi:hypothetical protein